MTGRTDNGLSVGFLEAVTARETARYTDADGTVGREVVSPLTNYFVGRLRRTMAEGRTVVAGMATLVHRRLGDLPFVHWSLAVALPVIALRTA